jgi:hypothetical protein
VGYRRQQKLTGEPRRRDRGTRPPCAAQQRVDQTEQECEERGGVVTRHRRMAVCAPVPHLVGRVLRREVGRDWGFMHLVQPPEGPVAEEQRPREEERQEFFSGRAKGQAVSQAATV